MPDRPASPSAKTDSPFASFRGHHVGLRVVDYDAVRDWYVDVLDFRVVVEWEAMDLTWAYLSPATDDDFQIELMGGPVDHETPRFDSVFDSLGTTGFLHICLGTEDVDAAVAELERRGVHIASPTINNEDAGVRIAFVRDPWGNMIELAQSLDPTVDG